MFDALVLDRDAVLGGQLWRLWSGHWVHLDARHAAINLAALVLMALIAALLLLTAQDLQWYAGLSGLLHGWAAWLLLRRGGGVATSGALLLAGKLVWEQVAPAADASAFPVIHAAHVIGALVGAALALPGALRGRRTPVR